METKIISVVALVALITLIYKALPFRLAEGKKPLIAFFPKYKKRVSHNLTNEEIERKLSEFGFKKTSSKNDASKFSRGSILGDISIKLAKVNVGIQKITDNEHEITVQAGWVAAFDTGDHWQFLNELCNKIKDA